MSALFVLLGGMLVVGAFLDALSTTLWVDGSAGPLSLRIAKWTWRGALAVARHRHRVLSLVGPFVLSLIVFIWVAMLWLGWTLIFSGDPLSVIHSATNTQANWPGRVYFVGYLLFTSGLGDYVPNGAVWQLMAVLTNMTGLLLATLAITYILSIISAVVQKRAFASQVSGLGRNAAEIVESGWNGHDLHDLDLPLSALASQLEQISQQYRAYPVLQYYHPARPEMSPAVAAALFDDALTLIRFGVLSEHRPSRAVIRSARSSIESFLDTAPPANIHSSPEAPPAPDLAAVASLGIPTLPSGRYSEDIEGLSQRRERLLGLLKNNGWGWEDTRF
ncbi:Ion channel [Palleronia marisminoris]|uniref:Potassium channel domain-containing protein n=1 Tax=Palleronia marisminoris TaxID=315423 RepID=A0A1Y5TY01_9RHOB|nr:potassium channel family protein [Palleronia marisminoris]SFH51062.1 Ion channel [Palleronia marisminoris]SLN70769.1 hypothetical protein PAM7066_03593 [Palleronia marisminoris]